MCTAKKKTGGVGGASLSEEEKDVIDLARVEAAMQASLTALKWEYTNTLVTRITPGIYMMNVYIDTANYVLTASYSIAGQYSCGGGRQECPTETTWTSWNA